MTIQERSWSVDPETVVADAMRALMPLLEATGTVRQTLIDAGFSVEVAERMAQDTFSFMLNGGRKA